MIKALRIFSDNGGILRTSQALSLGISPRTLYELRDSGSIRRLTRGIYQISGQEMPANPDLTYVSLRIPKAVICLTSALQFYGLTLQIPHRVHIALPQPAEKPRLEFPPLDIIWLSSGSYSAGIETYQVDGIPIKIYSREKTIADCFKFRNKLGKDVAIEALKEYLHNKNRNLEQLLFYAKIDRVDSILSPYLEVLI